MDLIWFLIANILADFNRYHKLFEQQWQLKLFYFLYFVHKSPRDKTCANAQIVAKKNLLPSAYQWPVGWCFITAALEGG